MTVEAFLDTNIFLYAASKAPSDQIKGKRARTLIAQTRFGISLQVVQEFYVNARNKARLKIPPGQTAEIIDILLEQPCVMPDAGLFRQACLLSEKNSLSYWDAAMIVAASELKAPLFFSEDLNHGQEIVGVRVVNPFL